MYMALIWSLRTDCQSGVLSIINITLITIFLGDLIYSKLQYTVVINNILKGQN